jgi:TonB family protein
MSALKIATATAVIGWMALANACHTRPRLIDAPARVRQSTWSRYVSRRKMVEDTKETSAEKRAFEAMSRFLEHLRRRYRFTDADLERLNEEARKGDWLHLPMCRVPSGVILVGIEIVAPIPLEPVRARYTAEALRSGIEGVVIVSAVIDKSGAIHAPKVLRGLPAGLSERALEAVRNSRWHPALICGKPAAVQYTMTINFDRETQTLSTDQAGPVRLTRPASLPSDPKS